MMPERTFIDVILPLSIPQLLTYAVPAELRSEISIGKRVIVQMGRQRIYSAIVRRIHADEPTGYEVKNILSVLDEKPLVNEKQLLLWDWIASYYVCRPGDVMNSALPASLKLQSETKIILNPEYGHDHEKLGDKEYQLYEALLLKNSITLPEAADILRRKSAHAVVKSMIDKGVVLIEEELHERYKPRREARIQFGAIGKDEVLLKEQFEQLEKRSPKQLEMLMTYMKLLFENTDQVFVKKNELMKMPGASAAALNGLVKKNILEEFVVNIDRVVFDGTKPEPPSPLSPAQEEARKMIQEKFGEKEVALLHGVTSSGKTEIYIHLIEEQIKKGKQVLYLLPEIALTTQIISRLQKHFGDGVGVYHSRYSSNERVETWNHVLKFNATGYRKSQVVLGARSALFLPFSDLGLVIIDEEHDSSYKQADPAPRYHARDTAIMLAKFHGAKTLLGSATPSLESYYNAEQNRYGLVKLSERYGGVQMPEIIVADVKEATRKKLMKSHFTPSLLEAISSALQNKEQVILFQNRRGFSPYLECRNCNWIPHCQNCSVTLTYHKFSHQLKCHYCGYSQNPPASCAQCGDHHLEVRGFGTEKIEEDISILFPEAAIARMDLDATRTKLSFHRIITDFEERRIDILVGTQMVTKGLDFDNASTVGIINADQLLNYPDFRAFERSFQLMAQVSGRSGRKSKRGKVIIQTQQPDHWVIKDVVENNYEAFYQRDLLERRKFHYPPLSRLVEITLKHKDPDKINESSNQFASLLRKTLGNRVFGPHQPVISRIRNLWMRTILIKIEREASAGKVKELISQASEIFYAEKENHSVQVHIDVDPV
ncbi:MAG: primosomal protein N' [Bacteroidetes bacterium]|nr:primosomal protein N' [Bacteroidota bacterium]